MANRHEITNLVQCLPVVLTRFSKLLKQTDSRSKEHRLIEEPTQNPLEKTPSSAVRFGGFRTVRSSAPFGSDGRDGPADALAG